MAEAGRPEQPAPGGGWQAGIVGCLSAAGAFGLCLMASLFVAGYATRDLPRSEAYEALSTDLVLAQWGCGGLIISLAVAVLAGSVCGRWVRAGRG